MCTHLRRIFAKLGVGSRAAKVAELLELVLSTRASRAARGRVGPTIHIPSEFRPVMDCWRGPCRAEDGVGWGCTGACYGHSLQNGFPPHLTQQAHDVPPRTRFPDLRVTQQTNLMKFQAWMQPGSVGTKQNFSRARAFDRFNQVVEASHAEVSVYTLG